MALKESERAFEGSYGALGGSYGALGGSDGALGGLDGVLGFWQAPIGPQEPLVGHWVPELVWSGSGEALKCQMGLEEAKIGPQGKMRPCKVWMGPQEVQIGTAK